MAIRFGSSDAKIWLRFRPHLTAMIIKHIRNRIFTVVSVLFQADVLMHNYAFYEYLCMTHFDNHCAVWSSI